MILGISGTRHGVTLAQERAAYGWIGTKRPTAFNHGSCAGVDVQVACIVRKLMPDCRIVAHPGPDGIWRCESGVDDITLAVMTHFARNRGIVNASDEMLIIPREYTWQARGGTWFTFDFAMKCGRPTTVIWPNGEVVDGKDVEVNR
jgi:hypothetical protein